MSQQRLTDRNQVAEVTQADQLHVVQNNESFRATVEQVKESFAHEFVAPSALEDFETSPELDARDTANRDRDNHTGTQTASTISDFETAVSANSDVTDNTAHRTNTDNPHQTGLDNLANYDADENDITNINTFQVNPLEDKPTPATGKVWFNETTGSLNVYGLNNEVIPVDTVFKAKNTEGTTLTKGQVVRLCGCVGNIPTVDLADASDPQKSNAIGLVLTDEINNNAVGMIQKNNLITGLDTSAYDSGTVLYLSETAGELTDNETAVKIGVVVRSHANEGSIFISIEKLVSGDADMEKSIYDPQNIEADAFDRGNHTGEQAISTVTGLQSALDDKLESNDISDFETTTQLDARDTANRDRANHTGTQPIASVDNLQTTLDDKLESGDISDFETTTQLNARDTANRDRNNHTGTQAIATVDGLQAALDDKANDADISTVGKTNDYGDLDNIPSEFTPSAHTHTASDVTDFDTAVSANSDVVANTAKRSYPQADEDKLAGIDENANNYTHPNHTGDVTSDGDGATTIADGAVSKAKTDAGVQASLDLADSAIQSGDLATVATTGDYDDLTNTPTIPTLEHITYETAQSVTDNLGNLGTAKTIDFDEATNFRGTLDDDVTITIDNVSDGQNGRITLYYSGSKRVITWVGVYWVGEEPEAPDVDEVLVCTLFSDGENTFISGELSDIS